MQTDVLVPGIGQVVAKWWVGFLVGNEFLLGGEREAREVPDVFQDEGMSTSKELFFIKAITRKYACESKLKPG